MILSGPRTNNTFDVAVIGAGVFGAWTAYQLRSSGRRVVLIDAHGAGNSSSSSGDESRIMRMGYGADEIYTRSAERSLQLWKTFCDETGASLFHQSGVLWLAHDDDPYPLKTLETLQSLGIGFERLTTTEVSRRYPQFNLNKISWAIIEPESGVLLARRAVQAVVEAAVQAGVEYFQDAVAAPISGHELQPLTTVNGRRISAGDFIFACGPWLPKIFPGLLRDRIQPSRQEVFYFRTRAGDARFTSTGLPAWIDFKEEVYGLPDIEGRGAKIAIDRHGPPFDPDSGDRVPSLAGLEEARQRLAERLPALKNAPVNEARVCQYENTSNGDFLIDRHPEFRNVWLVGGGSGHGFKHGPYVGEYVAARIAGDQQGIEPRFGLETKAREQHRAVY
jgi:sarcosine oxidase